MTPDPSPKPADDDGANAAENRLCDVSDIIQRLHTPPANPVTRARLRVEQEVPLARRGPGWDRHWRELEAYVDSLVEWQTGEAPE